MTLFLASCVPDSIAVGAKLDDIDRGSTAGLNVTAVYNFHPVQVLLVNPK